MVLFCKTDDIVEVKRIDKKKRFLDLDNEIQELQVNSSYGITQKSSRQQREEIYSEEYNLSIPIRNFDIHKGDKNLILFEDGTQLKIPKSLYKKLAFFHSNQDYFLENFRGSGDFGCFKTGLEILGILGKFDRNMFDGYKETLLSSKAYNIKYSQIIDKSNIYNFNHDNLISQTNLGDLIIFNSINGYDRYSSTHYAIYLGNGYCFSKLGDRGNFSVNTIYELLNLYGLKEANFVADRNNYENSRIDIVSLNYEKLEKLNLLLNDVDLSKIKTKFRDEILDNLDDNFLRRISFVDDAINNINKYGISPINNANALLFCLGLTTKLDLSAFDSYVLIKEFPEKAYGYKNTSVEELLNNKEDFNIILDFETFDSGKSLVNNMYLKIDENNVIYFDNTGFYKRNVNDFKNKYAIKGKIKFPINPRLKK